MKHKGEIVQHAPSVLATTSTFIAAACAVATLALGVRPSLAAGDPEAGQRVFAECAGCHATAPGVNKIGPSLAGVVGRKSGTVPGYNYTSAMKSADITWDDNTLDKFLAAPSGFVHGTKMFISVPSSADRQNVIAYLGTLKGP
jgi:cytochrome c